MLLFALFWLTVFAAYATYGWRRWRKYVKEHAEFTAGELARRLGLCLVDGEPAFNPVVHSQGKPGSVNVYMHGAPQGLPVEFTYFSRTETSFNVVEITRREWFHCRMVVQAVNPFPPFEVTSRWTPTGAVGLTQALPEGITGRRDIDTVYRVATRQPAMAAVLGEVLSAFSAFGASGVHLVGDGSSVAFIMQRTGSPSVAAALPQAEAMAQGLTLLARRVGG